MLRLAAELAIRERRLPPPSPAHLHIAIVVVVCSGGSGGDGGVVYKSPSF